MNNQKPYIIIWNRFVKIVNYFNPNLQVATQIFVLVKMF